MVSFNAATVRGLLTGIDMPHDIRVSSDLGLIVVRASGTITLQEFFEYRSSVAGHPDFHPDMRVLIDLSAAAFRPTIQHIHSTAAASPFSPNSRKAIVVPDDLHYGLARMWSALGGSETLDPFRTIEEACDWLAVRVDSVLELFGNAT